MRLKKRQVQCKTLFSKPTRHPFYNFPPKKNLGEAQAGGQKGRGWGEGIFARLLSAPKERLGWEAARPCVSKEAKPVKIDSLIEKIFCACPLKNVSIFTGFVQRSGGEPLPAAPPTIWRRRGWRD